MNSENTVYDADSVIVNHAEFRFSRFRFYNFYEKVAEQRVRLIVENIEKILEIG